MSRTRRPSRGKRINPHFWVFCEGETEEAYIGYLRAKYRLPIEIIPKVSGSRISDKYIERYKRGKPTHEKDQNFLIYDGDVIAVLERLKMIRGAELIISNPSIELWFLLHYKNQTSAISEASCIRELCNRNKTEYKKGKISSKLKDRLDKNCSKAAERAKALNSPYNPSTNLYIFVEILENVLNQKKAQ